jgi:hypothetical protein
MNTELDELYRQFLNVGFFALREASDLGDLEWLAAEVELLHNVPSLLFESNQLRHEYFWRQERSHYIKWTELGNRENQKERVKTFYEPIWRKMEPLICKV